MTAKEELLALPLDKLKDIATEAGLGFHPNIGAVKLVEKILAAQEAEGDAAPEVLDESHIAPEVAAIADKDPAAVAAEYAGANVPYAHTAEQTGILPDPEKRKFLEMCNPENVRNALAVHERRGLEIKQLDADFWHIRMGNREDSGNMKMPLKTLVQCANMLMSRTAVPTEGMEMDEILEMKRKAIR